MGDLQAQAPQPGGVSTHLSRSLSSSFTLTNPDLLSIPAESLWRSEKTTCEIIHRIQPTIVSDQRRKAVIEYIQRLMRIWVGCEIFPFGSVPLKTYLPDGDIDLTAVRGSNVEDTIANEVRLVLEGEEQNQRSEFEVKDVQYIHAEVKLVKCLVQNIVVDISFNQLGGLSTLCFLEQVDHLIGKDHLFKRSIILIKAWCYYESRILGAHHGLISTYALETLVLYIFHLFHSSLNGPLAVLYRFLDYFSKFDWDNYCVSLHGPVAISSLPEIVAETPETDAGELLLSKEFLKYCLETFSVPSKGAEAHPRTFSQKHLNIIDPMKENNNLGRSVSKGNFYRIRSAFSYGARKLGRILLLPAENIRDELKKFFQNTLDRHGNGQRPDVIDPVPAMVVGLNGTAPELSNIVDDDKPGEKLLHNADMESSFDSSVIASPGNKTDYGRALTEEVKSIKIVESEMENGKVNEMQTHNKVVVSSVVADVNSVKGEDMVSSSRLSGDAQDLATHRVSGSRTGHRIHHAPHLFFSSESEMLKDMNQVKPTVRQMLQKSNSDVQSYSRKISNVQLLDDNGWQDPSCISSKIDAVNFWSANEVFSKELQHEKPFPASSDSSSAREIDLEGVARSSGYSSSLSDLRGDFDSHLKSLLHGTHYYEYVWRGPVLPIPPLSPSGYRSKPWDTSREPPRLAALKRGSFPHMNLNGVVPAPQFSPNAAYYPITPLMPGAYNIEEIPKQRGTGTYFPNTNHRSYKERQSPGRGGKSISGPPPANNNHTPRSRNNTRSGSHTDSLVLPEKVNNDDTPPVPQLQLPAFTGAGRGKLEFVPSLRSVGRGFPHPNGFITPPNLLEFGSFRPVQLGGSLPEQVRHVDSSTPKHFHDSGPMSTTSMFTPGLGVENRRDSQGYHLKDEEDFPPLSM